jgi:hypothetical protein
MSGLAGCDRREPDVMRIRSARGGRPVFRELTPGTEVTRRKTAVRGAVSGEKGKEEGDSEATDGSSLDKRGGRIVVSRHPRQ